MFVSDRLKRSHFKVGWMKALRVRPAEAHVVDTARLNFGAVVAFMFVHKRDRSLTRMPHLISAVFIFKGCPLNLTFTFSASL